MMRAYRIAGKLLGEELEAPERDCGEEFLAPAVGLAELYVELFEESLREDAGARAGEGLPLDPRRKREPEIS